MGGGKYKPSNQQREYKVTAKNSLLHSSALGEVADNVLERRKITRNKTGQMYATLLAVRSKERH